MEFFTRKLVMQGQLNAGGSLFGGQCLSWIDEESAIVAISVLKSKTVVTKCISKIDFKAPAKLGDIVEIGTKVSKIGTTSITISCTIRNMTTEQEIVTVDEIVFVHLGEDGRPKPHGIPTTELPKTSTPNYAEVRRRIDEINKLYCDLEDYARPNDLYLNTWIFRGNPSGLATMSEEEEAAGWTASNAECGYKPDQDENQSWK